MFFSTKKFNLQNEKMTTEPNGNEFAEAGIDRRIAWRAIAVMQEEYDRPQSFGNVLDRPLLY